MTNQITMPLVPDWVLPIERLWRHKHPGRGEVLHQSVGIRGPVLRVRNGITASEIRDLLPALAFFAREGRLPTRDDQPKEAQGDE